MPQKLEVVQHGLWSEPFAQEFMLRLVKGSWCDAIHAGITEPAFPKGRIATIIHLALVGVGRHVAVNQVRQLGIATMTVLLREESAQGLFLFALS